MIDNENFNENESAEIPAEAQEPISTIFSDPAVKNDTAKRRNPKKLIAILLSICIVIGAATTAAIILIPRNTEQEDPNELSFEVMLNDLTSVEKIEYKTKNESITFLSEVSSAEADDSVGDKLVATWSIEGIDKRLIDSTKVEDTVHYFANIYAIKKLSGNESDYGLDDPYAEVTVTPRDSKFKKYTVKMGHESGDKIGRYITISGVEGIYLVDESYVSAFTSTKTDFATKNAVKALEKTDELGDYFDDNDALVTCDSIVLSGRNFPTALTFTPNDTEATKTYSKYLITSPFTRYAASVDELFVLAENGLVGNGAYVFNPTEADIKRYGLDDPLARVQIKIGSVTYDVKISEAPKGDDDYYCLIDQNREAIFKVSRETLSFVSYSQTDFYSDFLTMEMLESLSDFNISMGGKNYNYSISENKDEDDKSVFNITLNGKPGITQEYFQNFYTFYLSLELVEYTTEDVSAMPPVWTATLKHNDKSLKDVQMNIYKISDQRYQVNINGDAMGLITSSAYKKLIKYSEAIAQNKDLA